MNPKVELIGAAAVTLVHDGASQRLANDDVVACAGRVLPTGFLMDMGITIERHFGPTKPNETMESNVAPPEKPAPRKPMTPAHPYELA